ncbi:MAG: hypothetical protein AB3N13_07630, partial [Arenibacterium sp.]
MTDKPSRDQREEAVALVAEELERDFNWAKKYDAMADPIMLNRAFPNGYVPCIVDDRWESISAVPDDGSHEADLINSAEDDKEAFEAAKARAFWLLKGNFPISPEMREFVANALMGNIKPKGKAGRRKANRSLQLRRQLIGLAVDRVIKMGFPPSRSGAVGTHDSACDIVCSAMRRISELPATYDEVFEIYKNT